MDYGLLLSAFTRDWQSGGDTRLSQQHRLYACLRAAILRGTIAPGARLPASRALAQELGIARNSVLYAYEQLAAEGFVAGSRQGTVVAHIGLSQREAAVVSTSQAVRLSSRAFGIRRSAAEVTADAAPAAAFAPGLPALNAFPLVQWRRCLERAWRKLDATQLGYLPSDGNEALRHAIAEYVRVSRGVRCDATQVLITEGTQSSLDLCARTLADAGDTVWIENPGYGGAQAAFRCADLRCVPVGVDADGLAPQPAQWRDAPPRLIYITPSHQYPLGAVMSLERRLALLQRAHACGAWIIEDDYDSEFRHHGTPLSALQGLTPDAPVVYLGTFSKVMFPALRLGFMVMPGSLVRQLSDVADRLMPMGRAAEQLALAEFIDSGHFTRHLRNMRKLYKERRNALQAALQKHVGNFLTVSEGAGGMHLSARLDVPVPDTVVSEAASSCGIVMRPLSPFCLPGTDRTLYNGFVLGYGAVPCEAMDELARRMRRVIEGVVKAQSGHQQMFATRTHVQDEGLLAYADP